MNNFPRQDFSVRLIFSQAPSSFDFVGLSYQELAHTTAVLKPELPSSRALHRIVLPFGFAFNPAENSQAIDIFPPGPLLLGVIGLKLSSIRTSIGTENPIPEKMDHREIAVRVPVMNEMKLLFAPEPRKPLKPRSVYVVFLVEKDVCVERRRTCYCLNHEEVDWQQEVCTGSHQKQRDEEEGGIVAFVTEVRP
jgi:hypothetical protein